MFDKMFYFCSKNNDVMKKIKTKEDARAFFQKIIDDKKAMIACIERGGDLRQVAKERGIKLYNPLSGR